MRGILFPSSNVLFDVQTQDPSTRGKVAAHAEATTTSSRYGDVYEPWQVVDAAAISIAEAARFSCRRPPMRERQARARGSRRLAAVRARPRGRRHGRLQGVAIQESEAVSDATNVISDACANCHKVYRDRPTAAERCTPLP
jgi:hypothetical protein